MDQVRDVYLRVGVPLDIAFKEAASAGYLWSWTSDSNALTVTSESEPHGDGDAVGALNSRIFSAVATAPGTHKIKFVHKRPWENEADKTVRYVLHVKP